MELSESKINKFLIFSQKKLFLYFKKWNPALFKPRLKKTEKKNLSKKFLYFQEMELSGSNIKKFLIFLEMEILKNFLYFRK